MSKTQLASPKQVTSTSAVVGTRVNAITGRKFVTGTGRFLDDIMLPGMLHARFVRSPHAHARILNLSLIHI